MKVERLFAREILDSRGNPTIEVELTSENGIYARAAAPSGASTGVHEAMELRDSDESRYRGKGVLKAVANVNELIAPQLIGKILPEQSELDRMLLNLDGTPDKSRLGANAILAVSLAAARAHALEANLPLYRYIERLHESKTEPKLPMPLVNIFNGGAHAANSTSIQEFMIVPRGAADFEEAVRWSSEIFHQLKANLEANGHSSAVGDEGGFAPGITDDEAVLTLITQAIEDAGYHTGSDVAIALDIAASEFYEDGTYHAFGKNLKPAQLIDRLEELSRNYPIISIEDGLDENAWDDWRVLMERLGERIQLVGDDLLVTNPTRLKDAITQKAANAILIKPNQIGTLSETLEAITLAQAAGWNCIISHRSGETTDTFITHLAVGTGAGQIKTGSMSRGERIEKYNELLRISQDLQT